MQMYATVQISIRFVQVGHRRFPKTHVVTTFGAELFSRFANFCIMYVSIRSKDGSVAQCTVSLRLWASLGQACYGRS